MRYVIKIEFNHYYSYGYYCETYTVAGERYISTANSKNDKDIKIYSSKKRAENAIKVLGNTFLYLHLFAKVEKYEQ